MDQWFCLSGSSGAQVLDQYLPSGWKYCGWYLRQIIGIWCRFAICQFAIVGSPIWQTGSYGEPTMANWLWQTGLGRNVAFPIIGGIIKEKFQTEIVDQWKSVVIKIIIEFIVKIYWSQPVNLGCMAGASRPASSMGQARPQALRPKEVTHDWIFNAKSQVDPPTHWVDTNQDRWNLFQEISYKSLSEPLEGL